MRNWFLHPRHGYMLRAGTGTWQTVVTALCQDTRETEESASAWEAHKLRLHVNGGCGAVAVHELRIGDHNPEFAPVQERDVPEHIRAEFLAYVDEANSGLSA